MEVGRYHPYLRRVLETLKTGMPTIDNGYASELVVKASNDTEDPDGAFVRLLVFREITRLPMRYCQFPGNAIRMGAARSSSTEMSRLAARARLETALQRNTPSSTEA